MSGLLRAGEFDHDSLTLRWPIELRKTEPTQRSKERKMEIRRFLVAATALAAITSMAVASAAPVEMTDDQLNGVTAGCDKQFDFGKLQLINMAIALNNLQISGIPSAVSGCTADCPAVIINIIIVTQIAIATAGGR